jgi:hypothetical protein
VAALSWLRSSTDVSDSRPKSRNVVSGLTASTSCWPSTAAASDRTPQGIAAATERGLIVPNIKDAGRMSLRELAGASEAAGPEVSRRAGAPGTSRGPPLRLW